MIAFLFLATCFLAYSNGANDNFKGVASLFGRRTCSYKTAISWATITTRQAKWKSVVGVLLSWVITLPCAAALAALAYLVLRPR